MEPFISFIVASIVPIWIERVKNSSKRWFNPALTGDEVLFVFCFIAGVAYLGYVLLFEPQHREVNSIAQNLFFVVTTFWAGASGSYGLLYKDYFKKRSDQRKTK